MSSFLSRNGDHCIRTKKFTAWSIEKQDSTHVSFCPFQYARWTGQSRERGVRVSRAWRAGVAHQGETVDGVAHVMDLAPTFLELAGAKSIISSNHPGDNIEYNSGI